jgi:hypothetical protein
MTKWTRSIVDEMETFRQRVFFIGPLELKSKRGKTNLQETKPSAHGTNDFPSLIGSIHANESLNQSE